MTRLTQSRLAGLTGVELPGYPTDRFDHTIVHLGIGAFHRAHQAVYTDSLNKVRDTRWGIVGCSLRSPTVKNQLTPQDCLYTVLEKGATTKARIVGSIHNVLVGPESANEITETIAAEKTAIVSLTVTEKGYCHFPATGALNTEHPDIQHDLQQLDQPKSAVGFLVSGLKQRLEKGLPPVTVLSCDNLPHNGKVVAQVVTQFAESIDPHLAQWIKDSIAFPCTMVDRIVPATTEEDIAQCESNYGYQDHGLVVAEPFSQWVIENRFSGPRPQWEDAGALLVDDVDIFETMKLRLLNGSHSLLAYAGYLAGCETVYQTMQHGPLKALCQGFMKTAADTLEAPRDFDIEHYQHQLIERFSNPSLKHRTWQIAMDGSQKVPQRWLASLRELAKQQKPTELFTFAIAAWIRFTQGVDESGNPIEISDPLAERFRDIHRQARDADDAVSQFMAQTSVFGDDLDPLIVSQVQAHFRTICTQGINQAMQALLD